jgi:hypothetical protein
MVIGRVIPQTAPPGEGLITHPTPVGLFPGVEAGVGGEGPGLGKPPPTQPTRVRPRPTVGPQVPHQVIVTFEPLAAHTARERTHLEVDVDIAYR